MFSKDRQEGGGPSIMFASALKMMGLKPEIVEAISHGLLHNLGMVVSQQAELLARQEYFMRRAGIWDDYLAERASNGGRTLGDSRNDGGPDLGAGAGGG